MVVAKVNPPLWGNFVGHADKDLLSFACLYDNGLYVPGFYHATQAVEKYLKSLALSIVDPDGISETPNNNKWLHTHDLCVLANRCKLNFPYYGQAWVLQELNRFTEFDQAARYPWVKQRYGNGFSSLDLPIFWDLISHLRTDIPIKIDDYLLGILIRGFHHGQPEALVDMKELGGSVDSLNRLWPDVKKIVRW